MSKLLAGVIAALVVGVGVAAASSLTSRDDPTPAGTTTATVDSTGTTETTGTIETTGTTETGEDISGPCDEAEHANDPRCTGVSAPDRDDRDDNRSGESRDGDDDGDRGHGGRDDDGDRSGSNSGPG